jgi:hypothetical protein
VSWSVEVGDEFRPELFALHEDVRTEILALARLLQQFGPQLGRPRVGYAERLPPREYEGVAVQRGRWRVEIAFAFDTRRKGILLVAGDKSGGSEKRFLSPN